MALPDNNDYLYDEQFGLDLSDEFLLNDDNVVNFEHQQHTIFANQPQAQAAGGLSVISQGQMGPSPCSTVDPNYTTLPRAVQVTPERVNPQIASGMSNLKLQYSTL
jgi:hypothetical protein